jgi:tetratricopeptide (TPR) repeat protein
MVKERNNIWLSEMQFWESVVATFPESSVAQSSIGGVFMKEGNYPEAMTHINEAIRIDAGNYKAWYNKGVLHLRRNELQEGLNALNRCIEIHEYPKAFFSRALLYHQQGNVVHAARDIEKVLAEEPENARAYFIRGSCMEKMENYLSAIDNYDKAVMYGGYDKVFFLRRGISYVHAGKYAAAMGDLSVVTERNGNIGEAWYWLGIAKQLNGQTPCNDLSTAHKLGYTEAAQALEKFCNGK